MLVWLHSWLISRPKRRPSACVPVSWIAFDLSPIHALSKTETECRPGLDLEVEFTNEEIEWAISALQQQPCSSKRPGRIDLRSSFFFVWLGAEAPSAQDAVVPVEGFPDIPEICSFLS